MEWGSRDLVSSSALRRQISYLSAHFVVLAGQYIGNWTKFKISEGPRGPRIHLLEKISNLARKSDAIVCFSVPNLNLIGESCHLSAGREIPNFAAFAIQLFHFQHFIL